MYRDVFTACRVEGCSPACILSSAGMLLLWRPLVSGCRNHAITQLSVEPHTLEANKRMASVMIPGDQCTRIAGHIGGLQGITQIVQRNAVAREPLRIQQHVHHRLWTTHGVDIPRTRYPFQFHFQRMRHAGQFGSTLVGWNWQRRVTPAGRHTIATAFRLHYATMLLLSVPHANHTFARLQR